MELYAQPYEPNVSWHSDFICGLKPVYDGVSGRYFDTILSVIDAFSGMVWLLPTNSRITARETGELMLNRIMLEEARGLLAQLITDRDKRYFAASRPQRR